jgi:signal transduction histidine kinase
VERSTVERLEALDELKNAFLNAVSHELRTPLTTVLGNALTLEQLGGSLGDEDRNGLLRSIAGNARRIERLLGDLLDVDRLRRGIAVLNRTTADLALIVAACVETLDLRGRSVHVDVPPTTLEMDTGKVERMIENYLTNAVRHTPDGASVWVRAERQAEGLVMVVEDDGPGVPEELRAAIFEPFRQGRDSRSPGLGIGLSLVARFAELHGGRAWVEERVGGGASFRVLLPDVQG